MVAAGCYSCAFLSVCGGIEPESSLLDCFALTCCGNGKCDNVCPNNPDFLERMKEIGGLRFDDVPIIGQKKTKLPTYVPLIHHGYSRPNSLQWPVVALKTYSLFRLIDGRYRTIAQSAGELRRMFSLNPDTQIMLCGVAKDPPLERYWSHHTSDCPAKQLARLGISCAIGPNYSHFLDVPRTDNLFNRKRQLFCLAAFSAAGVSPIPHLNANTPGDWELWRRYLLLNDTVRLVAAEFQTGNKKRDQGLKVIERIKWLEQQVGRRLHPVAIGASQFATDLGANFRHFTVIDSEPFIKSIKRQRFEMGASKPIWSTSYLLPHIGIEDLLDHNLREYASWMENRAIG
jgi:hypothetical protein